MIGSFVAVGFYATIGIGLATGTVGLIAGLLLTLIVAMAVSGSLNVLIERVGYRPLRNAPKLAPLITAVGFSFILQNVGLLWRGGSPIGVPDLLRQNDTVLRISGSSSTAPTSSAIAVTIPLVFGVTWFLARARAGRAMRATAQDPEAAALMGINVDRRSRSRSCSAACSPARPASSTRSTRPRSGTSRASGRADRVHAAVMGGIGNVRGAVLGGLIIGIIQQLSDARDRAAVDAARRVRYLILIMVLRPRGCWARRRGRRDEVNELSRSFDEWRDAVEERLPPWWPHGVSRAPDRDRLLLPLRFAQTSGVHRRDDQGARVRRHGARAQHRRRLRRAPRPRLCRLLRARRLLRRLVRLGFFFKAHIHVLTSSTAAALPGIPSTSCSSWWAAVIVCAVAGP
jgi:branched-chain amino acid transport system permease protein